MTKDGKLQSWSDFKKDAYAVSGDYNGRWLEAEYHQTVATANMAAKWEDFQRNKDLYPNLKYVTVGDGRVRPEHQAWEGVIRPIDDPWWSTHYPPNDWGCRCDVEQTDEDPTEGEPKMDPIKEAFRNNAAQSGKIFQSEAYSVDLSNIEKDNVSIDSLVMLARNSKSKLHAFAKKLIYDLPLNKQFRLLKEFNNGGKVTQHILVNPGAEDYQDVLNAAMQFAKDGKDVQMLPEIHISDTGARSKLLKNLKSETSNPDLKVGKKYMDVKRPNAIKNITGNANKASSQGAVAVISDAKLKGKLSHEILQKRAEAILSEQNKSFYDFQEVFFYVDGKIYRFP